MLVLMHPQLRIRSAEILNAEAVYSAFKLTCLESNVDEGKLRMCNEQGYAQLYRWPWYTG